MFAIIANVSEDGVSFKARSIVKTFLRHHLKTNLINRYLVVFDHYLELHHPHLFGGGIEASTQTLSDSEKLKRIASEINRSLLQREKFIVFLRLVEFINEDDVMTEKELAFIKTVADTFNISRKELDNTKAFILNACNDIETERLLIIDNNEASFLKGVRHIREPELEGRITILHHASTDTFIFRYLGNFDLSLNGNHIIPERFEMLDQGSRITGPKIKPIYYSDISRKFHQTEEKSRIYFTAEDIEFRFKNSNKGIKKFSFSEESGNLIGVMGGSGAGKSTLLSILCGKLKPQRGKITINGIDIHSHPGAIEGIIGLVPQDDLLMEDLTVFRNLYLNAKLCLSNLTETEVIRRVNRVLTDLDLEEVKHLKVGNPLKKVISGGQRKRLNIALELIREPAVLFVDEPTSGLSSMGSEKVMLLLKEQALKGRLVIVNIHQPYSDIYKLFDRFLILDKEGHVIYKGNPIDAITYFKAQSHYVNAEVGHCESCGNVMPEEILKIVEEKEVDEYGRVTNDRRVTPEEWYELYRDKIESRQHIRHVQAELPPVDFHIPPPLEQFRIFNIRNILSKLANRQYMLINFLEAPLLALIIGYFTKYTSKGTSQATYELINNVNLPPYIFMAVIVAMFLGLTVSVDEIITDRKILERESFLRLSRLSYLNSKILVLFLISAIQTLTFVLVGNEILEIRGMLLQYWLILFSVACLANMIGLNISSGLDSMVTTHILIPFILVPQLLFSGVLIKFDRLNSFYSNPKFVPIIGDLMHARWGFEALAVHQYKNNGFYKELFPIDQQKSNADYYGNFLVPELIGRVNLIENLVLKGEDPASWRDHALLLHNELDGITSKGWVASFGNTEQFMTGPFPPELFQSVTDSLEFLRNRFNATIRYALRQRDLKSEELIRRWGGEEAFNRRKYEYSNNRLEELVTNKLQMDALIEWRHQLIRKMDPIHMEPLSRNGRAHFYAPEKLLGNLAIDTFWFNFMVIWLSSGVLYLTLVYDVLRRFTSWQQLRRLRRKK
ncbi:MAG: ATP-binding cassette domain-containing protein [Bacteroidales bacterium]